MSPAGILLTVLATLLVLAAAYAVHAVVKYSRMISNIFLSLVYVPAVEPSTSSIGERHTILDSAGRQIDILHVARENSRRVAVFCHESGATKDSWERYAYFLPSLGYHVISVDALPESAPAGENSLHQWPVYEGVHRAVSVIRWAKRTLGRDVRIALFGVSNGADIALAAAQEDPNVRAVVADGLFSMKEIFRDYIRRWGPILVKPNLFGEHYPRWVVDVFAGLGFRASQRRSKRRFVDVERILRRSRVPVLMIHGQHDDYVPESHQRFLQGVGRGSPIVRSHVVEGAGHNQAVAVDRTGYEKLVGDFLRAVLP